MKKKKIYVPKDEKLRIEIIQLHHNILVAKYREKWKTIELVTRNYWWQEVIRNIGKYVEGCNMYQRMKNKTEALIEKLKLSEISKKP